LIYIHYKKIEKLNLYLLQLKKITHYLSQSTMADISTLVTGKRPIEDDKKPEKRMKYGYYPKLIKHPLNVTGEIPKTFLSIFGKSSPQVQLISERKETNLIVFNRQFPEGQLPKLKRLKRVEDLLNLISPVEHLIGESSTQMQLISERRDSNLQVFKRQAELSREIERDLLHLIGPDEHLFGDHFMQIIGDPTSLTIEGDPFNDAPILEDVIEKMLLKFERFDFNGA